MRRCARYANAAVTLLLLAIGSTTLAIHAAADKPPQPAAVLALAEKVADWQLAHLQPIDSIKTMREETRSPRSWQQATFYGVGALLSAGSAVYDLYR